jgi:hypothetical protein
MVEEKYRLGCLLEGETQVFTVSIPPSEDVHTLKTLIYKVWEESFSGFKFSPVQLELTKVHYIRISALM